MLPIRTDQFEMILISSFDQFVSRLVLFLTEHFSEAKEIHQDELFEAARRHITVAGTYGLITEAEVGVFFVTAWLLGEDFPDEFPAARVVLDDGSITGADKADWLSQWVTELYATLDNTDGVA